MTFTVMSIWKQLLSLFTPLRSSTTPYNGGSTISDIFPGFESGSSVQVDTDTALSISTYGTCVKILAESIASLPFSVYRRDGDQVLPATDHPLYYLLHDEPHEHYTSFTFREAMMYNGINRGNAIAKILRDGLNNITGFQLIPTDLIEPIIYNEVLYYYIPSVGKTLMMEDVIHIPFNASNGLWGVSPIQQYKELFGEVLSAKKYNFSFYENGVQTTGVLTVQKPLTDQAITRLRKSFQERQAGSKNSGKTIVLEEGMDYKPVSMSPADAKVVETDKIRKQEISALLRVPLHMINSLERSTDNNIEHQGIGFIIHTILPIVKRWEMEFNRKVFTTDEMGTYFVRFNLEGLLRGDIATRSAFYTAMFNIGVFNANEIRALENMNPVDSGNTYFRPLNMIDAAMTSEQEQQLRSMIFRNTNFKSNVKEISNGNGHEKAAAIH